MTDNTAHSNDDAQRRADIASRLAEAAGAAADKDSVRDAEEARSIERILDNLGLRESTLDQELQDDSIADVVSTWSASAESAFVGHRGDQDHPATILVDHTDAVDDLFATPITQLTASVTVSSPEAGVTRVETSIAIPGAPEHDAIAEVVVNGRATPLRFPLQLVNHGSEDFPLHELVGAASVLERDVASTTQIVSVRLASSSPADEDQQ